jgi:hypothetical protein
VRGLRFAVSLIREATYPTGGTAEGLRRSEHGSQPFMLDRPLARADLGLPLGVLPVCSRDDTRLLPRKRWPVGGVKVCSPTGDPIPQDLRSGRCARLVCGVGHQLFLSA